MRTPLLLLFFIIASLTSAQAQNQFLLASQQGFNFTKTQSIDLSFMAGIKTEVGDQFLAGIVYKHLLPKVGHKDSYIGLRLHAQTAITEKIAPFLGADFLRGEYYTYGEDDVFIKKNIHLKGTLGIAYLFSENLGLFVGYSVGEYNPLIYFTENKSPYKSGSINLKLSLNFILGKAFALKGGQQRRMW